MLAAQDKDSLAALESLLSIGTMNQKKVPPEPDTPRMTPCTTTTTTTTRTTIEEEEDEEVPKSSAVSPSPSSQDLQQQAISTSTVATTTYGTSLLVSPLNSSTSTSTTTIPTIPTIPTTTIIQPNEEYTLSSSSSAGAARKAAASTVAAAAAVATTNSGFFLPRTTSVPIVPTATAAAVTTTISPRATSSSASSSVLSQMQLAAAYSSIAAALQLSNASNIGTTSTNNGNSTTTTPTTTAYSDTTSVPTGTGPSSSSSIDLSHPRFHPPVPNPLIGWANSSTSTNLNTNTNTTVPTSSPNLTPMTPSPTSSTIPRIPSLHTIPNIFSSLPSNTSTSSSTTTSASNASFRGMTPTTSNAITAPSSSSSSIRRYKVEAALRSKPQRGKKRDDLSEKERQELTRSRNREHAKTTRIRKKARYQELLDSEMKLQSFSNEKECNTLRCKAIETFLSLRQAMIRRSRTDTNHGITREESSTTTTNKLIGNIDYPTILTQLVSSTHGGTTTFRGTKKLDESFGFRHMEPFNSNNNNKKARGTTVTTTNSSRSTVSNGSSNNKKDQCIHDSLEIMSEQDQIMVNSVVNQFGLGAERSLSYQIVGGKDRIAISSDGTAMVQVELYITMYGMPHHASNKKCHQETNTIQTSSSSSHPASPLPPKKRTLQSSFVTFQFDESDPVRMGQVDWTVLQNCVSSISSSRTNMIG